MSSTKSRLLPVRVLAGDDLNLKHLKSRHNLSYAKVVRSALQLYWAQPKIAEMLKDCT